jgi:MYXO-CTERM domain-containing protein
MSATRGALCAAILLAAPSARANGRFPTAQQIAPSPTDPKLLALMATFGVEISQDQGANWDWACELAVGYQSNENPVLGVMGNGAILVGAFEGLGISTDVGCSWSSTATGIADPVVDLVVEASDPHSAFVVSSKYRDQDDAGATFVSRVWVTHDDGAHFAQVGADLDPEILPETIDVAPSDATRVYVSGTRRIAGAQYGVLLASSDGGKTFTEADFPFVGSDAGSPDRAPYIAAVDPTNPSRVYVRVQNIDGTRLLVSDDGLATTRQVWQAKGDLLGFALSADGTKVYVGGPNDGLHVTTRDALDFGTQVWPGQVQCLAFQGARLLACSNEVSGFVVGASTDDGATWAPLLHLACVRGPLACGPTSAVTVQCAPNWSAQQQALGWPDPHCPGDGGADASADASSPPPTTPAPKKSGCSTSSPEPAGPASLAGAALAAASLAAYAFRRRRAKR